MPPVVDPILVISCECGRTQEAALSRVIAEPAVVCTGCGQLNQVSLATRKAALQHFGGEVFDLSRWEPRKVRSTKRRPRKRIA